MQSHPFLCSGPSSVTVHPRHRSQINRRVSAPNRDRDSSLGAVNPNSTHTHTQVRAAIAKAVDDAALLMVEALPWPINSKKDDCYGCAWHCGMPR